METYVSSFKLWMMANNKAKSTVDHAVAHVKDFLMFHTIVNLTVVNTEMIMKYFAGLRDTCSQSKLNQINWSLKQFFAHHNVTTLQFPKSKLPMKKIKIPITEKELEDKITPKIDELFKNPLQTKAILYFMFYTGLRKGEICIINRKDFLMSDDELIVTVPKQNIQKKVYITKNLKSLLNKYFESEPEIKNAFNTSEDKIDNIIEVLKDNEILGPQRQIWPHLFRDSFACHCLLKGMNLLTIKELMGHKDIKTTEGYLTMCQDLVKKEFLTKMKGDNKLYASVQ